jgi:hypothetical protein
MINPIGKSNTRIILDTARTAEKPGSMHNRWYSEKSPIFKVTKIRIETDMANERASLFL